MDSLGMCCDGHSEDNTTGLAVGVSVTPSALVDLLAVPTQTTVG